MNWNYTKRNILLGFVWSAEGPVWEDGVLPVCLTQSMSSPLGSFFQLHCSVLSNVQVSVSEKKIEIILPSSKYRKLQVNQHKN